MVAGLLITPHLLFQRTLPPWTVHYHGITWANLRLRELPAFLWMIIQNALHFTNGVGLPKWNILWPLMLLLLVMSKSPRRYPWNSLVAMFILHAAAVSLVFLCITDPYVLGGFEFGFERYTLIMLQPLWLVFAKCVEEWWQLWKPAPEVVTSSQRRTSTLPR